MLTVDPNLRAFRMAAGEPFLFDVRFYDTAGVVSDLSSREFVVSFYDPTRNVLDAIAGTHTSDNDGVFIRFQRDGSLSEALFLQKKGTVAIELAERFAVGREIIASGILTIDTSAAMVADYGNAPLARYAAKVNAISPQTGPAYQFTVSYGKLTAVVTVTLGALALSSTSFARGVAKSITISGRTAGSTITATASDGTVLTVS